jgi:hypothetical protein
VLYEPVPDHRRFMGAVVVHDDVHVEPARHSRLDEIEKFAELSRVSSYRPSRRCRTKRPRHLHTVASVTWSHRATTLLSDPSAHAKMMRARRATWCRSRAMRQRVQSSPFVLCHDQRNLGASRSHARLLVEQYERAAICFSFYRDRTLDGRGDSGDCDPVCHQGRGALRVTPANESCNRGQPLAPMTKM